MPQNIFEGSAVTLTAKASKNTYVGKPITFEMQQKGKGVKIPNHNTQFDRFTLARYEITLPKVHDDDVNYQLEYNVKVGDETRLSSVSYLVWPKLYEIEAVTEEGDKGKFCEFDVGGGDNRGLVSLNSEGKGHYEPGVPGEAPTFEIRSPYELVSWEKATGRKRKAKVKRKPYTAEFFEPAWADIPSGLRFESSAVPSKQGFKQVVNLDGTEKLHYGESIVFKVGASGDKGRSGSTRYGKKDDEIYVKVEFDANNSRRNDNPKPGVYQKIGDPLVEAHTNQTQTFTVKLGEEGAPAEFEVVVGAAGGDKIKVSIGVTSACQDASYEIITDRRVFYQVTRNAGQEDLDLTRSEEALAEVGVSLSRYKIMSLDPTDQPSTGVSWIPGEYWGTTSPRLNVGNYNSTFYHNKWSSKGPNKKVVSPRLHVLYTDVQYDSENPVTSGDPDDLFVVTGVTLDKTHLVQWSDGTNVVGTRIYMNMASAGLFNRRLYDGSHPFIDGVWQKTTHPFTKGKFSSADIWMDFNHLTIKLPAACEVHLNANHSIAIAWVRLAKARGPFLGEADNGKILCVVSQSLNDINDTLTHEVGHVIGLVPSTSAPPGLDVTEHTRRYTGNEHEGGHCAKGMSAYFYANGDGRINTAYHLNFSNKGECTCVMYGENNAACTGKFCDLCIPFGRAGKI